MKNASSCAHVRTVLFFAKLELDNNQEKKWPWKKRGSCAVRKQKWRREKWRNGSFSSYEACVKQYIRSRPPSEAPLPSIKRVALWCGSVRVLSAHVCYCFVLFSFLVCVFGLPWLSMVEKKEEKKKVCALCHKILLHLCFQILMNLVQRCLTIFIESNDKRHTSNSMLQLCLFVYLLFFWLSSSAPLSLFVFPLRLFVSMCICIYLYMHLCAQTLTHFHKRTHANIWRLNPQKKKTYHYDYVVYFQSKNWGKRA